MPGIVGFIRKRRDDAGAVPDIGRMVKSLVHEKFYTSGSFRDDELGLAAGWVSHPGSPPDGGPVWNEAREIGLIFAGEDLQDTAAARPGPAGTGAAGALLRRYEDRGEDFLRGLNGGFSGLLIDRRKQRIVLFNDRFGLGRIYFHENDRHFLFASEAKALLQAAPELRELDPAGLAELFTYGCVLGPRTLFADVGLLPGASRWAFSPGRPAEKGTYFRTSEWEDQPRLDEATYADRFVETFPRVLEKYLGGPRTVGISLTGGIDTRMIMAWAPCLPFKRPCYTFSGVYRDCADVVIARKIAAACQQRHEVIRLHKDFFTDFPALAKRSVLYSDGTMDVSGAAELYMNRRAREIAPVRLTGNYGDQVVRGVIGFKPLGLSRGIFDDGFAPRLDEARRDPLVPEGRALSFFCGQQAPSYHYPRQALESSQLVTRSPFLDIDLVALAYQAPEAGRDLKTSLRFIHRGDPVLARIPTDRGLSFPPRPLLGPARRGLRTLSKKAEYAYDYGMPQWLSKLDRALSGLRLERLFLGRHKYYHFRVWYRRELQNYVQSVILDPRTLQRSYFRGAALEKMVREHLSGRANFTQEIHWVLTSELVQRHFIEKGEPGRPA
jgi:asparagine synthase (glutamine-hydrolysing)